MKGLHERGWCRGALRVAARLIVALAAMVFATHAVGQGAVRFQSSTVYSSLATPSTGVSVAFFVGGGGGLPNAGIDDLMVVVVTTVAPTAPNAVTVTPPVVGTGVWTEAANSPVTRGAVRQHVFYRYVTMDDLEFGDGGYSFTASAPVCWAAAGRVVRGVVKGSAPTLIASPLSGTGTLVTWAMGNRGGYVTHPGFTLGPGTHYVFTAASMTRSFGTANSGYAQDTLVDAIASTSGTCNGTSTQAGTALLWGAMGMTSGTYPSGGQEMVYNNFTDPVGTTYEWITTRIAFASDEIVYQPVAFYDFQSPTYVPDASQPSGTRLYIPDEAGNGNDLISDVVTYAGLGDITPVLEGPFTGPPAVSTYPNYDLRFLNKVPFAAPGTGVNDYYGRMQDTAPSPLLDGGDELTVGVWVNTSVSPPVSTATNNRSLIVGKAGRWCLWRDVQGYGFTIRTAGGDFDVYENYYSVANQWLHLGITYKAGSLTLYIDGQPRAWGFQGAGAQRKLPIIANNGSKLSVGESNEQWKYGIYPGFYMVWKGAMDNLTIYNKALSGMSWLMGNRPTGLAPLPKKYTGSFSTATNITCEYGTLTVNAQDNSGLAATPAAGTTMMLSTSTGAGTWSAPSAGSISASSGGSATYTWPGGISSFTIRLTHTTVGAVTTTLAGPSMTSGTAATTFVDAVLRLVNAFSPGGSIPVQIANKPSNTGYGSSTLAIQAIRTDTNTGTCTAIFPAGATIPVDVGWECVSPGTCAAAQAVLTNSAGANTTLPNNSSGAIGLATGTYTSTNLVFGANSAAQVSLRYPEAGSARLHVRYLHGASGKTYYSATPTYWRPYGFRITGTDAATPLVSGRSGSSSSVLTTAGTNFPVTIAAVRWENGQDAGWDGIPDSAAEIAANALTTQFNGTASLVATVTEPSGGVGSIANGTFSSFSGGVRTQQVSFSEVGIVSLTASATNYLVAGSNVTSPAVTGVGRFIPASFSVLSGSVARSGSCSGTPTFVHMGEPRTLSFTVRALNALGAPTTNYTRGVGMPFMRYSPATSSNPAARTGATGAGTNLTSRLTFANATVGAIVTQGDVPVTATVTLVRPSPDTPDGPYSDVRMGVAPVDLDTVSVALASMNYDVNADGTNDRVQVGTGTTLRYERVALGNPSLLPAVTALSGGTNVALAVPLAVQSWNGLGWSTDADDNCTSFSRSNFVLESYSGNLSDSPACETALTATSYIVAGGATTLSLAAPGAANAGAATLRLALGASDTGKACTSVGAAPVAVTPLSRPYYRVQHDAVDSDGNANTALDDDPRVGVTFNAVAVAPAPRVVYRRELY